MSGIATPPPAAVRRSRSTPDIYARLRDADERIAHIYARRFGLPQDMRIALLVEILDREGSDSISDAFGRSELDPTLQTDTAKVVEILAPFWESIAPTYTVASYWSPLDGRRRSIWHRQRDPSDLHESLAAAVAFYAVTFEGAEHGYYSLTQYIAERAPRKRAVAAAFVDPLVVRDDVIDLSMFRAADLFKRFAWSTVLAKLRRRDTGALTQSLRGYFSSVALVRNLGATLLNAFCSVVDSIIASHNTAVAHLRHQLATYFADDELTEQQVCFIVVTHLLWRCASPSDYMYAFPTSVGDNCCVVTVGTASPLDDGSLLSMSYLSRSLFVHPLLFEYAEKEAAAELLRRNQLFRRLLGHNLPKLLIWPAQMQMSELVNRLESTANINKREIVTSLQQLELLFNHYESVLLGVMSASTFRSALEQKELRAIGARELLPKLRLVVSLLASAKLHRPTGEAITFNVTLSTTARFVGHELYVLEILFNILGNAVKNIDPRVVAYDRDRARITLKVYSNLTHVVFEIRDRGVGIAAEKLAQIRETIRSIDEASGDNFWSSVDDVLETKALNDANEENMGIGLIFCAAYLRSLEAFHPQRFRGSLRIESERGAGTVVIMALPRAVARKRK